ncbi:MAG: hypothetical protein Q9198_000684 [Flavoplaca austrocitrina]
MVPSFIPEETDPQHVIRIAAGLSSNEADTTSGNQPGVVIYDAIGRKMGSVEGKKKTILDGDFVDIQIPLDDDVGKKPAEYISIANGGDDALCIAYIAITQPDGREPAYWYPEMAMDCGAEWYPSQLKPGDNDYTPKCIWIDRDRSNGLQFQGLGFHLPDLKGTEERSNQLNENRSILCDVSPRLRLYEDFTNDDFIPFFDPPLKLSDEGCDLDTTVIMDKATWKMPDEGPNVNKVLIDSTPNYRKVEKRSVSNAVFGENPESKVVIISTNSMHSARELCESETSRGFDFVSSTENLYCDMEPKRLWPVCSNSTISACFDVSTSTMRPGKGLRGRDARSGRIPPAKHYGKTVHWR